MVGILCSLIRRNGRDCDAGHRSGLISLAIVCGGLF